MQELPTDFIKMLHDLLGDEASDLIQALDKKPVTSVRLNKRKPGAEFVETSPVKWCKSGFYLDERPEFIMDPLLHAGAYYVQDASSMVYETVTEILLKKLTEEGSFHEFLILDLCAAPGGKTTAMINALPDGAFVTANEYSQKRVGALKENLSKWGYPRVRVTNHDSSYYVNQGEIYDIVAVDAPCSGEGMMRKEEVARSQWSGKLVEQCSQLQKDILLNAEKALKPGGFLIYSTCTFNRSENEENAEFIFKNIGLEPVDLSLPQEWGIQEGIQTELPVKRFMPHKTKGEGLFLSVFRKPGIWIPSVGAGDKFQCNLDFQTGENDYPFVEVNKETALSYLRRESIKLNEDSPRGMVIITYKGLPLGQAKNIGSRANNLYPKHWRILKR